MMSPGTVIFAGTRRGVARIDALKGGRYGVELGLEGSDVRCIAVDPGDADLVFAGTWDEGLHRSWDGGRTWQPAGGGIAERRILSLAARPTDGGRTVLYAGSEPVNLYRSDDQGTSWQSLGGLHALPSASRWYYGPRPGGQRVRSIAPHPSDPATVFAAIEVGGVMRSQDGGQTWEDHKPNCFEDSHALATHRLAPQRIYQAASGGAAVSLDAGDSWRLAEEGLDRRFLWALAVDTADPELWYVSAAYHPREAHGGNGSANAAIYRKRGDAPWHAPASSEGMAEMPFALLTLREHPGALIAGCDSGRLLRSEDAAESWEDLGVRVGHVHCLQEAPG